MNWFRKEADGDFSGPASGKICACSNGSCGDAAAASRGTRRKSAGFPTGRTSTATASTAFRDQFRRVMAFIPAEWRSEILSQGELFLKIYDNMPKELVFQRELLASRLS